MDRLPELSFSLANNDPFYKSSLLVDLPTGARFAIDIHNISTRNVISWLYSSTLSTYLDQVRTLDVGIARAEDFASLVYQSNGKPPPFPALGEMRFNHRSKLGNLAPMLEQWLQKRAEQNMLLECLYIPGLRPSDLSRDQMEILERVCRPVEMGNGKVYAPHCFPDDPDFFNPW
jgi:hypothetical protein